MGNDNVSHESLHERVRKYYGAINEIAKSACVSRKTVSNVLKGDSYNEAVIEAAERILKERAEKRRRLARKLSDALQSI